MDPQTFAVQQVKPELPPSAGCRAGKRSRQEAEGALQPWARVAAPGSAGADGAPAAGCAEVLPSLGDEGSCGSAVAKRCQADSCGADLSALTHYHQRNHICKVPPPAVPQRPCAPLLQAGRGSAAWPAAGRCMSRWRVSGARGWKCASASAAGGPTSWQPSTVPATAAALSWPSTTPGKGCRGC